MRRTSFIIALALTLPFSVSSAAVIRIPSQVPAIQDAIDLSSDGDTLLVAPGTYTGWPNTNLDFSGKSVSLLSEGGADVTTIDGEGGRRAFGAVWGEDVVIEGFTVVNGYLYYGGGVLVDEGSTMILRHCRFLNCGAVIAGVVQCTDDASAVFEDCLFQDNYATEKGGVAFNRAASLTFNRCDFIGNSAPAGGVFRSHGTHSGPANYTTANDCTFIGNSAQEGSVMYSELWYSRFYATDCVFSENTAVNWGLLDVHGGRIGIDGCLFEKNVSESGWLVYAGSGWSWIANTTFVENSASSGIIQMDSTPVTNVVVAFSAHGPAVSSYEGLTLTCCDFYGNAGGDWTDSIASQLGVNGNICEDPLFCGSANPESPYSLHENSPCAAANSSGCGTIGLYDEACGFSATENLTWGSIKALYR